MKRSIHIVDKAGTVRKSESLALPIYSVIKPMIARVVIELGIDLDAPVNTWIGSQWLSHPTIQVKHLLNHSSGLRDHGHLPQYKNAIAASRRVWSDEEFARHTLLKPLLFEPGTGFSYSNPGYWLLTRIIENQTGLTLAQALASRLFTPLGMHSARLVNGQFDDALHWYPAEWVWHGLVIADAMDLVRFMRSLPENDHMMNARAVPPQPPWIDPHYGNGLMIEPGVRFGHNGTGPGFSASCFQSLENGFCGAVIMESETQDAAMHALLSELAPLSA